MKIPLSQGFVVEIDDEDAALVEGYSWHILRTRKNFYAVGRKPCGRRNPRKILLHRLLLGAKPGEIVDHKAAARAYDAEVRARFGRLAFVNFPDDVATRS